MKKRLLILTVLIVSTTMLVLSQSIDSEKITPKHRPYTFSTLPQIDLDNGKIVRLASESINIINASPSEFVTTINNEGEVNLTGMNRVNLSPNQDKPGALYYRPNGFFVNGLDIAGSGKYHKAGLVMLGAAFVETQWINLTPKADSYLWDFAGSIYEGGSTSASSSTDVHPVEFYESDVMITPKLKATASGVDSTYNWGIIFATGGDLSFLPKALPDWFEYVPSVGNLDLDNGLVSYRFADGDYVFGTNPRNDIDAIVNVFDKPLHKYILNGVHVNVGSFKVPADITFELIIHRLNEKGHLTDTIATSAWHSGGGVNAPTYHAIMFNEFYLMDETGLELTQDFIEIEDGIAIEMKGFNNNPNITMSCFSDEQNKSIINHAYLFDISEGKRSFVSYKGTNTLAFGLDVEYSYLAADDNKFNAPTNGGEKLFNLYSYYSIEGIALEEELPAWLSNTTTFDEATWAMTMTLKAEALPEGITYREANVKLVELGADYTIKVTQGVPSGLNTPKDTRSSVISTDEGFQLSYPQDFSFVSMYTLSGQQLNSYQLPESGNYLIPTNTIPKGIYMLRFTGKSTETVKIVK